MAAILSELVASRGWESFTKGGINDQEASK